MGLPEWGLQDVVVTLLGVIISSYRSNHFNRNPTYY